MNGKAMFAVSQEPIHPGCRRGLGAGLQQQPAAAAMFAVLKGGHRPLSRPVVGLLPFCVCPVQSYFYSNANVSVSGSFYFQRALTVQWFINAGRTLGSSGLEIKSFPKGPSGHASIW